ncbi:MAG: glycosyl transferase [Ectothiorhodospiraceae bacterium]|nr:glycosyl transferase [Ectothiorhodospiraceae bacterium]
MASTVSIILPTYNRAELVGRAIQSVLDQTYPHFELIVVDDGSTDSTPQIVRTISNQEARVKYFEREHAGQSAARNFGMEQATGDFITFIDSDDEYMSSHVKYRVKVLQSKPEIDFLYGGITVIGSPDQHFVPDIHNPSKLIPIHRCIVGGTFFTRTGIIESVGGWKGSYGEDNLLFHRVANKYSVREISFPTYCYHRDGADRLTSPASIYADPNKRN